MSDSKAPRESVDDSRSSGCYPTINIHELSKHGILELLNAGWEFRYEPETHFIGAYHSAGGCMSVVRIEILGKLKDDLGHSIAAFLNGEFWLE